MAQAAAPAAAPATAPSAWAPLRLPMFRALWIATVVSNVGTWMHDVGAGWLMTSLDPDPLMVALVQAATTLPIFLFVLPSGVLADILDRRRFLMAAQVLMVVAALSLGSLALLGQVTAEVLLALTFLLGIGAAMTAPAFQAVVSELVTREHLPAAVALNSLGVNVSRAIGPALGGFIISLLGTPAVFVLNGISTLAVLFVLATWKRTPPPSRLPPEHFLTALRAGFRYVAQAPALQAVLVRAAAFFLSASALWALLPLVARQQLGLQAHGYGVLLACMGAGAVAGALILPRIRRRLSADRTVIGATVLFALAGAGLAASSNLVLACAAMLLAGFGWIAVLSSLATGSQAGSAGWVKARALSTYIMVFFGSMALGSTVWGALAGQIGLPATLVAASAALLLGALTALRWRLSDAEGLDLAPSAHWPAPVTDRIIDDDRGPVLISIEYRIDPADAHAFIAAMRPLGQSRRRTGALAWGVFEDTADAGRWLETFVVESWLQHLRQHELRQTVTDRKLHEAVQAFHRGEEPPRVSHFVAPAHGAAVAPQPRP